MLWRHNPWDATLLGLSIAQFFATLGLASGWSDASILVRSAGFALLVLMTVYNIIVVSHLFTHRAWFLAPALNRMVSMLNSINIGQSVQAYRLFHVRNHHRYHNDRMGTDGSTKDLSSTFGDGNGDDHAGLMRYAFGGSAQTLAGSCRAVAAATRFWRVGEHESVIRSLTLKDPDKRFAELRQVQLDRIAYCAALCLFVFIDWKWALFCYLPAMFLSFALVNVQNYFEHYGASPSNRFANSVSYYGRIYNLLTFNDGYHQEHHLRPQAHWSRLPALRREMVNAAHVVSPLPALLGFLDRDRRSPANALKSATIPDSRIQT